MTIAKFRAQAERLERELQELRQGRQPLDGQAVLTEEPAAAPAASGQQQQQQPGGAAADSGDAPMAEAGGQQPGGSGMWM